MFQILDPAVNLRLSAEDLNFRARILISDRGFEPGLDIRGHKVQDSTETRCRGFFILESWCRGFLSSEKIPWNHDVMAYLSLFLDVVVFWSWNLDVVAFWSWNPDVVVYCLHGLVFVIIMKTKKLRIIMSIMLLKNILIVQIYANLSA